MFLTTVLLVAVSTIGVILYVLFIHGSQVEEAARATYAEEAADVARIIDEAASDSAKAAVTAALSDAIQANIVVAFGEAIQWSAKPEGFEAATTQEMWSEMWQLAASQGFAYRSRLTPDGEHRVLVVSNLPLSGGTVGIEQAESPLHTTARRMRRTLLVGMIMAIIMAMISSWIAADKVTKPLHAIGRSANDITAGKLDTPIRVETRSAEIQDLADHLDEMHVRYREKIVELERLTRLQGEFIGNVSHEVRNPIFAISGYLEALGSAKLAAAKRKKFSAAGLMNLARLGNLFESLIEIARLEYREDWIRPTIFDVTQLAGEVSEMLRPKAESKGLVLDVEGEPAHVRADRDRIRRVLVNLIENAIVYSDQGAVRCHIVHQEGKVLVEIADQGRGIKKEHQEHIFERFYRVEPDRSRKSGGAGLGLSIVKQILQAHKETIHVASERDQGTQFWFTLPHAETPA